MKLAWIGLGVMGAPMAGHLSKQGTNDVTVYNRTRQTALSWNQNNEGNIANSPKDAAIDADIVFSCVGQDEDVLEIALGEQGVFHSMKPGSVFVDHTTASAKCAIQLAQEAKKKDIFVLDAPVSGGESGAQKGTLSIMVGGEKPIYDRTAPIMNAYGKTLAHIGPHGHGQMAKMVNQIAIAGLLQSLSEAIHFAKTANLDLEAVMSVIPHGAAGSWQMKNRWFTMDKGKFDHGFAVDLMHKDLSICLKEAETLGLGLPITKIVDDLYQDLSALGHGRDDTSSLIRLLRKDTTKTVSKSIIDQEQN